MSRVTVRLAHCSVCSVWSVCLVRRVCVPCVFVCRLCRVSSSVCFILLHGIHMLRRIDLCIIAAGLILCHVRSVCVCVCVLLCVCVVSCRVSVCVCVCVSSVSCVVECVFSFLARNSHVAQD